jgi:LacI family transcriptional regulator
VDGQYTFDSGATGAKTLLALTQKPTAIFCCNDEIAAGALFAARLSGFQIPQQLAIAGFEDSPFSKQTLPQLTTAAQPTNMIARKAASLLISHIANKRSKTKTTQPTMHQHFEPQLLIRESTQLNAANSKP